MFWRRPRLQVLFLCRANVCRSPLAEGLLRQRLRERRLARHIAVRSAGLQVGQPGRRPDPRILRHAQAMGVSLRGMRARPLCEALLVASDDILVMEQGQLRLLQDLPTGAGQAQLLGDYLPGGAGQSIDIADPYFSDAAGMAAVVEQICIAVDGLADALQARLDRDPGPE